jgi:hypothetical protein
MSNSKENSSIIGQSRSLDDNESQSIEDMIQKAQNSSRRRYIPSEDLAKEATTEMTPEIACVIEKSGLRKLLEFFNRNFLFGQGRFDAYRDGLLLKWGDGYSRKHIWITVVDGNKLKFETSHRSNCGEDFCFDGYHIYGPEDWKHIDILNAELADQFKNPVYERSDD